MREITDRLDASRRAIMDAISGLTEQEFRVKPNKGHGSTVSDLLDQPAIAGSPLPPDRRSALGGARQREHDEMSGRGVGGEGVPASSFQPPASDRPSPDRQWSIADILAHLFIVETMLLTKRTPFDEADKDDPEAALVRCMTVPQIIHGLVAQRRANLDKLEALAQQGHVTAEAMESFARHEEEHASQIRDLRSRFPQPAASALP